MPHPRKTLVTDQEIHWLSILETTCSIGFSLASLAEQLVARRTLEGIVTLYLSCTG